jgi:hypothetical protein
MCFIGDAKATGPKRSNDLERGLLGPGLRPEFRVFNIIRVVLSSDTAAEFGAKVVGHRLLQVRPRTANASSRQPTA